MQNKSQQAYRFLPRNIRAVESLQTQGWPQRIQAWKEKSRNISFNTFIHDIESQNNDYVDNSQHKNV